MTNPGPTKEDYDTLLYKLATLESELRNAQRILEAPAKVGWWRKFLGSAVALLFIVAFMGIMQTGAGIKKNFGLGILTGANYNELQSNIRIWYAMGLHDGIGLAPLFGAPDKGWAWAINCMEGMRTDQLAAVFDKYIKDHPERWHEPMNLLGYSALVEVCGRYR